MLEIANIAVSRTNDDITNCNSIELNKDGIPFTNVIENNVPDKVFICTPITNYDKDSNVRLKPYKNFESYFSYNPHFISLLISFISNSNCSFTNLVCIYPL